MKKTNPYLVNKKKEKLKVNVIQVFVLISFILLWELLSIFNIIDSFLFSSPSSIIKLLIVYIKNGILFEHIYVSVEAVRFLVGELCMNGCLHFSNQPPVYNFLEPKLFLKILGMSREDNVENHKFKNHFWPGLANIFFKILSAKEQIMKIFCFMPNIVCCNYSSLPLWGRSSHR